MFHIQLIESDSASTKPGELIGSMSLDGVKSLTLTKEELEALAPLVAKLKLRAKKG